MHYWLWVVCLGLNGIGAVAGMAGLFFVRLQGEGRWRRRTAMAIGWLLVSIAVLSALTIGFFDYLERRPDLDAAGVTSINMPLLLGTVIYITAAWAILQRAWAD